MSIENKSSQTKVPETGKENLVDIERLTIKDAQIKFPVNEPFKLIIPDYQRAYVWTKRKVQELMRDLSAFGKSQNQKENVSIPPNYYMGNVVLYKRPSINKNDESKIYEIVDGQQRLTTLLILLYQLCCEDSNLSKSLMDKFSFEFRSESSKTTIKAAQDTIKQYLSSNQDKAHLTSGLNCILLFALITENQDFAFQLFETQNNRGIKPSITDLLKAIHLRSINESSIQEDMARLWERLEKVNHRSVIAFGENEGFLTGFFRAILWRGRNISFGKKNLGSHEDVKKEFATSLEEPSKNTFISFYPSSQNQLIKGLNLNKQELKWNINRTLFPKHVRHYPFQFRQPLQKGLTLFKYVEKYVVILDWLFGEEMLEKEFRYFFNTIYATQTAYMRETFVTAVLLFIDRFGENLNDLIAFCYWWDYATGHLRQFKYSITKTSYINYIGEHYLYDKICYAIAPQQLFQQLQTVKITEFKGSISKPMKKYTRATYKYYWNNGDREVNLEDVETAIKTHGMYKEKKKYIQKKLQSLKNEIVK